MREVESRSRTELQRASGGKEDMEAEMWRWKWRDEAVGSRGWNEGMRNSKFGVWE